MSCIMYSYTDQIFLLKVYKIYLLLNVIEKIFCCYTIWTMMDYYIKLGTIEF